VFDDLPSARVGTAIAILLTDGRPPTISRLVITVLVRIAINRSARRAAAHIFYEADKRVFPGFAMKPPVAN
jgi:hypothetical protein